MANRNSKGLKIINAGLAIVCLVLLGIVLYLKSSVDETSARLDGANKDIMRYQDEANTAAEKNEALQNSLLECQDARRKAYIEQISPAVKN